MNERNKDKNVDISLSFSGRTFYPHRGDTTEKALKLKEIDREMYENKNRDKS